MTAAWAWYALQALFIAIAASVRFRRCSVLLLCAVTSYCYQTGVLYLQLAVYVWNLQNTWHLRKMQGPPPSWIFGNVLQVCQRSIWLWVLRGAAHCIQCVIALQLGKDFTSHLQFEKWYKKYGPVYKIYFGRTPVVVVTGMPVHFLPSSVPSCHCL